MSDKDATYMTTEAAFLCTTSNKTRSIIMDHTYNKIPFQLMSKVEKLYKHDLYWLWDKAGQDTYICNLIRHPDMRMDFQ
jgi:hypothetical protein